MCFEHITYYISEYVKVININKMLISCYLSLIIINKSGKEIVYGARYGIARYSLENKYQNACYTIQIINFIFILFFLTIRLNKLNLF